MTVHSILSWTKERLGSWSWRDVVVTVMAVLLGMFAGRKVGLAVLPQASRPLQVQDLGKPVRPIAVPIDTPDTPAKDWADSIPVPDWVYAVGDVSGMPAREYAPLGGRVSSEGGRRAPTRSTLRLSDVRPLLVQRLAGRRVAFADVSLGQGAIPEGRWALAGNCATELQLENRAGLGGQELGRIGEWVFALAVPSAVCAEASKHAVARRSPASGQRVQMAQAVAASPVVRSLGAPLFGPDELKDFAVTGDPGARIAWGVFRSIVETTRIYPPPEQPQLAFVAREEGEGNWVIAWAKYSNVATETLGLVGVYDFDQDGVLEAFFGVRVSGPGDRLLQVSADQDGVWRLQRNIPLPDLND